MTLNTWYEKGLTANQYMDTLEKHKEPYMHIYNEFKLPSADEAFFASLKEQNLRAVVLAEPWCGHCMLTVPVLLHLTLRTDMPVRFLLRDENLELMDQHLTNGKSRSIPIFLFINEEGDLVKKWGPIAEKTKKYNDKMKADLPPKEADDYDEKFKEAITVMTKDFRDDSTFWFGTYDSLKATLKKD